MKSIMLPVAMLAAIFSVPVRAEVPTPERGTTVHFDIGQIFGARPVVAATINGRPFRLIVHANAGSYLQINHADAKNVGAHDLKHRGAYGISEPGKVSDLGRDDGVVDRLAIGRWSKPSVPVAIFEVPSGGSQGMLGLPFLHDNNVIVDFAQRVLILPGTKPSARLADEMTTRNYSAHPLTRDAADGRYLVEATINGAKAMMVVSTVASIDLDTEFAKRADVAVGPPSGTYGGPSGATGNIYETATPVTIGIGAWSARPVKVTVEDTYAYSKAARPRDATQARGGDLGADFMIANRAVIDFGNAVLYLKDN